MAITAATLTSDFSGYLTRDQAGPIFDEARKRSVVQQLAQQVRLGPNGESIPIVTGKPTAGWVAEGGQKPASQGTRSLVTMDPEKIATIFVASSEVVRANPAGFMDDLREDAGEAFAAAFDAAALYGTSSPFASNIAATTKSVELGTATQGTGGVYKDLVSGLDLLVQDGKRLTGFAFGDIAEPMFLGATDTSGRPLFIDTPLADSVVQSGRLIGRPAFLGEDVDSGTTYGFGGNWQKAAWGAVGGISFSISTEAAVTINGVLTSLWENNLVGVRAEAEYGFVLDDAEHFVKYVNVTP